MLGRNPDHNLPEEGGESCQRQVTIEEGKIFAEERDLQFIEISARTGTFVETAFLMLADSIKTKMTATPRNTGFGSKDGGGKFGCC